MLLHNASYKTWEVVISQKKALHRDSSAPNENACDSQERLFQTLTGL